MSRTRGQDQKYCHYIICRTSYGRSPVNACSKTLSIGRQGELKYSRPTF